MLPPWLDLIFIKDALKDHDVKSFHAVSTTEPGQNNICNVFRVTAETSSGPLPLIIKIMPESELFAEFLREGGLTRREIRMYERTLSLLRGDSDTLRSAHCYHTLQDGVRDTLVLHDLGSLGFRTYPRHLGLDVPHCRLALKQLAHLHGFSVALRIKNPELFAKEMYHYRECMYTEDKRERNTQIMTGTLRVLAEALKKQLPFRFHMITRIMEHISENSLDLLQKSLQPEPSEAVLVLNHGDFTLQNLMFHYGVSGEPDACVPIDFQFSRCVSPALDLVFFLYSSTRQATRQSHFNQLLKYYLQEVRWALHEKGIQDPGTAFYTCLDELKLDMRRHSSFAFIFSCFIVPVMSTDPENAVHLGSVTETEMKEGEGFNKMYSGALFRERFKEVLEDLDNEGFFSDYVKQHPEVF